MVGLAIRTRGEYYLVIYPSMASILTKILGLNPHPLGRLFLKSNILLQDIYRCAANGVRKIAGTPQSCFTETTEITG